MKIDSAHRLKQLGFLKVQQTRHATNKGDLAGNGTHKGALKGARAPMSLNLANAEAILSTMQQRVAELEEEARQRREVDRVITQGLKDLSEAALETERSIAVTDSQVVIKIGQASITLKASGDISIRGKNLDIRGDKIDIKGSGDVSIKGRKIAQN